jgi:hypothetical protein
MCVAVSAVCFSLFKTKKLFADKQKRIILVEEKKLKCLLIHKEYNLRSQEKKRNF